jgi:hypothetical protein
MRSRTLFTAPVRLRRLSLRVGFVFALSLALQFALMTPGVMRTGNVGFAEMCTAAGTQRVLLASITDERVPLPASSSDPYCPLCILTENGAPPPSMTSASGLPESSSVCCLRPRADSAPGNSPDLRHAPPRAPPVSLA